MSKQTMLIIRDLPGIAGLEVDLLVHRNAYEGPLRCTRWLAPSAEVAARGIAGHMPDGVDRFAANLQRDRDAFIKQKRGQR